MRKVGIGGIVLLLAAGCQQNAAAEPTLEDLWAEAQALGLPLEEADIQPPATVPDDQNTVVRLAAIPSTDWAVETPISELVRSGKFDEARKDLDRMEPALKIAREAAALPFSQATTSHKADFKPAVYGLAHHAVVLAHDGFYAAALEELRLAWMLARKSETSPTVVNLLTRYACEGTVREATVHLAATAPTQAERDRLREMIEAQKTEVRLYDYYRTEFYVPIGMTHASAIQTKQNFMEQPELRAVLRDHLALWLPVMSAPNPDDNDALVVRTREALGGGVDKKNIGQHALEGLLDVAAAIPRAEAERQCVLALIAVLSHRATHGALPEGLPGGDFPDPYSGEPIRYQKRGDGFIVYSVGQDGRDDGGQGEGVLRTRKGGDIVIQFPLAQSS